MLTPDSWSTITYPTSLNYDSDEGITDMECSVRAVERILKHEFKNKKLLKDALTHSSCTDSVSYQRLEFVGDAALGLAITNYFFLACPELDQGQLSLLKAANLSTEKLARVAVKHGLYNYVRHKATALDEKVKEFVLVVQQEEQTEFHGGAMKAPKVLADIVESVAAAVYVDCGFDVKELWVKIRGLLEPIITVDLLEQQPQPVTLLFELCHKDGKHVDIQHSRKGEKDVASVYIDGEFIVSASSENKENAKLHAAKAALGKMALKTTSKMDIEVIEPNTEIEGAKQKLHELCGRKKWRTPVYRLVEQTGPSHDRSFVCSVEVKIPVGALSVNGEEKSRGGVISETGKEKSRVKDAENSAASTLIGGLRDYKLI